MQLAAEGVAPGHDVQHAEVIAVEHDHAGARAEHRRPAPGQVAQGFGQALALESQRHHGGLTAGDDQRIQPA
jgi:hypothetical protein